MKKLIICFTFYITSSGYGQTLRGLLGATGETYKSICTKMEEKIKLQKIKESEEKREMEEQRAGLNNEEEEFENEEIMFNRWKWYKGNHLAPGEKMINETQKNWDEFYAYQKSHEEYFNSSIINGEWAPLGPTNIVHQDHIGGGIGRVNRLVADPTNANIIYAGSANGGLWKTTDGAASWFCLTDGLPRVGVSGIAINPLNTNEIYILTGDGDYATCPSIGVLKSPDGGISWYQTGLTFNGINVNSNIYGRKLIINPTNPSILFAITDEGIYRTADAGFSWTKLWGANMRDIQFNTAAPGIVYAAGISYSTGNKTKFYRSLNSGVNWDSSGFTGWPDKSFSTARIAVTPANSAYLYAYLALSDVGGTGNDSVFIYRSINNGTTFSLVNTFPFFDFGQVGGDDAMVVSPTNASEVYLGCLNAWKSTSGGNSFGQISVWGSSAGSNFIHADHHTMIFAGTALYDGGDGGIFKSLDNGASWAYVSNELSIAQVTHLAGTQSNPNLYYFGSFDNGIIRYNNSTTATTVQGGDGFYCAIDPTNQNVAYCGVNGHQYKTTNGGLAWGIISDLAHLGFVDGMNPIVINPSNTNILYGANRRFYKSVNGGGTWTKMLADSSSAYFALALCKTKPNNLWGSTNTKIQRFNGITWFDATGNLPVMDFGFKPLQIAAHPVDSLTAWIALCGYVAGMKVYKTTNGGTTWTNISGTLPDVSHNSIAYDETNGDLYVGNDIGVFFRNTSMADWVPFMNGLPCVSVSDLYINYTNGTITAGTYGRGIWRSPLQTSCEFSYSFINGSSLQTTGYGLYEASSFINSNLILNHGYGTNITYQSAYEITLTPPFEVSNGSKFTATIDFCTVFAPRAFSGNLIPYASAEEKPNRSVDQNPATQNINNSAISLIPNPANDFVNIFYQLEEGCSTQIVLSDVAGRTVKTIQQSTLIEKGSHQKLLDTRLLNNGLYFIGINYNGKKVLAKLIVKH